MSDMTANVRAARRQGRSEYGLYFGLVFALALPEAAVLSLIALARGRRGPGLLRRAHLRAREITPRIFDA